MKILFKNIDMLKTGAEKNCVNTNVVVENDRITYIGDQVPDEKFDRIITGNGKLMIPGLYNAHCHASMTLFRGYGEDLPLDRWLNEKIFPAEDLLTRESVYNASMLACCEMIKNGIVSFTDMYSLCEDTANAAIETGIKANISRAILSFDESSDMKNDFRMNEAISLAKEYHNSASGRIKIDMALHAEYTNTETSSRYVAEYAKENGYLIQLHLSETEKEHNECIARRNGKTPLEFFNALGVLEVPVSAAHCVYVSDTDIELMKIKNVTAVHNPTSNLKLGSGVMRLRNLLNAGVNVALGTDGTASNNTLDVLKELHLTSILHKGIYKQADITTAEELIPLPTINGAKSQGRDDCGTIEQGKKADLILIDTNALNTIPSYDACSTLCYSTNSSNITLTMIDGEILYENGEFTKTDIEKIKSKMKETCKSYFK